MEELTLNIRPDGTIQSIYSDALAGLLQLGEARIERASHVEPADEFCTVHGKWMPVECSAHGCTPVGTARQWAADMGPSAGPVLGPFDTRADALAAEVAWLRENRGL